MPLHGEARLALEVFDSEGRVIPSEFYRLMDPVLKSSSDILLIRLVGLYWLIMLVTDWYHSERCCMLEDNGDDNDGGGFVLRSYAKKFIQFLFIKIIIFY